MSFMYVDVETVPLNKEGYLGKNEEEQKKLLNPIDSKIIAIGVKVDDKEPLILVGEEKKILGEFWLEFATFRKGPQISNRVVGFNIKSFDLPFLVTRSLINNVVITPFNLKDIFEIRETISAYRYGSTRGKLKEFGAYLSIEIIEDMDGSKVAETYWKGEVEKIKLYLAKDLEITQKLHKRMVELRIDQIQKW